MRRHETPHSVAAELAKHAPRYLGSVLDPAVGNGALIAPLLQRFRNQNTELYCIDIDGKVVSHLRKATSLQFPESATFVKADFLRWSCRSVCPTFDCVVMNPPFAASKLDLQRTSDFGFECINRSVPLEAAFTMKAVELLNDNGRLLAVLPCSIVMAEQCQWLRNWLLEKGAIRFIHELPPRSFPCVESRMYLLVFDKGKKSRKMTLYNHDLFEPEKMELPLKQGVEVSRWDFGFHNAQNNLSRLTDRPDLGWKRLGDIARVFRGSVASPQGPRTAIHSCDFKSGFWKRSPRHKVNHCKMQDRRIVLGDIIVKRVGRECYRSFGRAIGLTGLPCSDCLLVIRPNSRSDSLKILFALQVLFSFEWAKSLIERGTGATYLGQDSLLDVPLPLTLHQLNPKKFELFKKGQKTVSIQLIDRAITATSSTLT